MASAREVGANLTMGETMNTIRTIKLLTLSALALVAIGAVSASGAQAGTFTAGAYPATITGTSAAASHDFFTQVGVIECAPTFDSKMAAEAGTLTVLPNYGTSCSIGGNQVHVSNNGCDFRWHAGATIQMDVVGGFMDIVCPDTKIDFEITSEPVCHVTVPAQNGIGSLRYTNNTGAEDVTLDFGLENLFYELDNGCAVVGAFFGEYKGSSTLRADIEGGAGTSFEVD
jgi:hypothetical protein